MDEQVKELFFGEVDRHRLNFDAVPEYGDLLRQSEALFPDGDLPKTIFQLLETANRISFAHGLKLGLKLTRWAAR